MKKTVHSLVTILMLLAVAPVFSTAFNGCSSREKEEEQSRGPAAYEINSVAAIAMAQFCKVPSSSVRTVSCTVHNSFTKTINGEKIYYYDVDYCGDVKYLDYSDVRLRRKHSFRFAMARRGNYWEFLAAQD